MLQLYLFSILAMIIIIISEGRTNPIVAIIAPKIPEVLNPAKVAIFMPMGPGVDSDIAIISAKSTSE